MLASMWSARGVICGGSYAGIKLGYCQMCDVGCAM